MKCINLLIILVLVIIVTSCKQTPGKSGEGFNGHNAPASPIYKRELAKQIESNNNGGLTYIFNKYVKIEGKDYLDIIIRGDEIEAKGLILVKNWHKLENLKRTGGKGYSGAELRNLELDIIDRDAEPVFIYKDLEEIVD
ncbi:MAG: hypothetical protein ABIN95_12935 [Mucilaginibacter sp.]